MADDETLRAGDTMRWSLALLRSVIAGPDDDLLTIPVRVVKIWTELDGFKVVAMERIDPPGGNQ